MTKAAQDLYKFNPTAATLSPKWRDKVDKDLKDKKVKLVDWKKNISKMKTELASELKQVGGEVSSYETLLAAYHADTKDRLAKVMTMVKALGGKNPAPGLAKQAKEYCDDLVRDLGDPLTTILKKTAVWQGNRANFSKAPEIAKAAKEGSEVPVKDLNEVIEGYMSERTKLIEKSNKVTSDHKDKLKTYVKRALDANGAISNLAKQDSSDRQDTKNDLRPRIEEALKYFTTSPDGDFLKPKDTIKAIGQMATIKKDADFEEAMKKGGGDNRVGAMTTQFSRAFNDWKVHEKKIALLGAEAAKLKNDTTDKLMKKLTAAAAKNKKAADVYKAALAKVVKRWKAASENA